MQENYSDQKSQIKLFEEVIIHNQAPDIIKELDSSKPQEVTKPIQTISGFELLYYAELFKRSAWYNDQSDKDILNETINALINGKTFSDLTDQHIHAHEKYLRTPGNIFHEKYGDKKWYPKLPFTTGAIVTMNAGFAREDILSETKKLLNNWLGKKLQPFSQKTLNIWSNNNILAIHDLMKWSEIMQLNYMKIKARFARTLWENPPLDSVEKLVSAIKLSKKVIDGSMIIPLWQYRLKLSRKKQK